MPTSEDVTSAIPSLKALRRGNSSFLSTKPVEACWFLQQQLLDWEGLLVRDWRMVSLGRCDTAELVAEPDVAATSRDTLIDHCSERVVQNVCRLLNSLSLRVFAKRPLHLGVLGDLRFTKRLFVDSPTVCGFRALRGASLEVLHVVNAELTSELGDAVAHSSMSLRALVLGGRGFPPDELPALPELRKLGVSVSPAHADAWLAYAMNRRSTFFSFSPESGVGVRTAVDWVPSMTRGASASVIGQGRRWEAHGVVAQLPEVVTRQGVTWHGRAFIAKATTKEAAVDAAHAACSSQVVGA